MRLEEFVYSSGQQNNTEALFSMYQRLVEQLGFNQLVYAVTSNHPELSNQHEVGLVQENAQQGWVDHYCEKNYMCVDYVHHYCKQNYGTFRWQDLAAKNKLLPIQKQILDEAEEAKLFNGTTISVHGPDKTKAVVIASSSEDHHINSQHLSDILNIATYQLHLCFLALNKHEAKATKYLLTLKEQEVIKWVASGLTKYEVGLKMNLSSHTVDYHIRNIIKKTSAKNMTSALVTAIKDGAINI